MSFTQESQNVQTHTIKSYESNESKKRKQSDDLLDDFINTINKLPEHDKKIWNRFKELCHEISQLEERQQEQDKKIAQIKQSMQDNLTGLDHSDEIIVKMENLVLELETNKKKLEHKIRRGKHELAQFKEVLDKIDIRTSQAIFLANAAKSQLSELENNNDIKIYVSGFEDKNSTKH